MERIKQLRNERGFSQAKLAVLAGMDPGTLNRLEQGKGNPTIQTIQQVADALGVELSELLGYEGTAHHLQVKQLTQIQGVLQSIGNQLDQGNIEYARRFLTIAQEAIDDELESAKEIRRIKTGISTTDDEYEAIDERPDPLADALRELQASAG